MEDLEKKIEEAAIVYENQRKQDLSIVSEGYGSFFFSFLDGAKSEAAKEYWQQGMYSRTQLNEAIEAGINEGLRKQQKGMYSEEELKESLYEFCFELGFSPDKGAINSWFEQNKKK